MLALERGFHAIETRLRERARRGSCAHKRLTLAVFIVHRRVADHRAVRAHAYGLFPAAGHRLLQRGHGDLAGRLICEDRARNRASRSHYQRRIRTSPRLAFPRQQRDQSVHLQSRPEGRRRGPHCHGDQVIARLRPRLARVVGRADGAAGLAGHQHRWPPAKAQYQYTLSDPDLDELNTWAPKMLEAMQQMPQLRDVSTDQQSNGAAVNLRSTATPPAASASHPPISMPRSMTRSASTRWRSTTRSSTPTMWSSRRHRPCRSRPSCSTIYIKSPITGKTGAAVAVRARRSDRARQPEHCHQGQLPAVTLSFNLPPGVALGQVTKAIEQARLKLGAPATLSGSFQGPRRRSSSRWPTSLS